MLFSFHVHDGMMILLWPVDKNFQASHMHIWFLIVFFLYTWTPVSLNATNTYDNEILQFFKAKDRIGLIKYYKNLVRTFKSIQTECEIINGFVTNLSLNANLPKLDSRTLNLFLLIIYYRSISMFNRNGYEWSWKRNDSDFGLVRLSLNV